MQQNWYQWHAVANVMTTKPITGVNAKINKQAVHTHSTVMDIKFFFSFNHKATQLRRTLQFIKMSNNSFLNLVSVQSPELIVDNSGRRQTI